MTPLLWIAGLSVAAYYAYQNNWFGNFTVTTPAALPPVTPGNIIPISTLTPPAVAPVVMSPPASSNIPLSISGGSCVGCQ